MLNYPDSYYNDRANKLNNLLWQLQTVLTGATVLGANILNSLTQIRWVNLAQYRARTILDYLDIIDQVLTLKAEHEMNLRFVITQVDYLKFIQDIQTD
jgi:hypothetical protein